jgi:selenide,water dikinase
LAQLPQNDDPNLLVGYHTSDDAGIYRLSDDLAIVTTADFITPPVDDPYVYGQIAAANALSDIYAMGGRPLTCLNLVAFPSKKLTPKILQQIIAGALNKITEAGAVLVGGHSIEDDEPKFGLSVTGIVHPEKYWTNSGARPNDVLVLTKPIGSGVIFNANLKKWVSPEAFKACLSHLIALNHHAAQIMADFEIHAVTDITGFGLAGHALEMAKGSNVQMIITTGALPVMETAYEMYRKGMSTGVNANNRKLVEAHIRIKAQLPPLQQEIFYDPQTSGGLLAALPADQGDALIRALHQKGIVHTCRIGEVVPFDGTTFLVFI